MKRRQGEDERFMRQCLRLAARARGRTSPNPMVGTVIVKRGRVVATGYHHRAGEDHAEVDALSKAGDAAKGATLYVNIEPCNHRGRTGPCTDAILAAGIRRVVVGMIDPNPLVNGRGLRRLRRAGLDVSAGVLDDESRALNEGFVSRMERGRPFVTLKLASTADGRIATESGDSRWVSGERSRAYVHRLRAQADAILVGSETALRDDPLLTVRIGRGRNPVRVVADSRARLSPEARLLHDGAAPVIVAIAEAAPVRRVARLEAAGATVWRFPAEGRHIQLSALLEKLGDEGILTVLCEGGATLGGALVEAGLVDKLAIFYAPKLIGRGIPILAAGGRERMDAAWALSDVRWRRLGDDQLLEGYLNGAPPGRGAGKVKR